MNLFWEIRNFIDGIKGKIRYRRYLKKYGIRNG